MWATFRCPVRDAHLARSSQAEQLQPDAGGCQLGDPAQNVQVSSGQLGGLPALPGQQLNATVIGKTRLQTPEQFRNILLKVNSDGSQVRLGDVAKVELGGENYSVSAHFNGKPAAGLALKLATGANALDTVEGVRKTIDELKPFFPPGVDVVYPYDTTPVISASITGVMQTLLEAFVLVFLVMYLFLQNFRATLVPTLAVPVVLLGTFGVLAVFGFSINTLTMFAMILAIGLLVDDAIVVVENVERVMREEGLSPLEATRKSMGQIQGALIGMVWCCRRYCCRWPSSEARPGSSTAVLDHHRIGDGALGTDGADLHASAVCHIAEADRQGRPSRETRFLRLVQSLLRAQRQWL